MGKTWAILAAILLATANPARSGDDPPAPPQAAAKPIKAAEAKDHVDRLVVATMTVRHAKDGFHRESYYLDSEADYKSPDNLGVVISYKVAEAFKAAGIADVVAHYGDKVIRVTGTPVRREDQVQIVVTDPRQIEVVVAPKPGP